MSTKNRSRALTALVLILIFSAMYLLNFFTPYVADDFNNMVSLSDGFKEAVKTVITNQMERYYTLNGRSIAHAMGGFILIFNKMTVNILNTLFFCIFLMQICKFRTEKKPEIEEEEILSNRTKLSCFYRPLLILAIFFLLWYFTPVFGQNFLWIIGAANYLYTSMLLLIILRSTRKQAILDIPVNSFIKTLLLILVSIIAGWTNENSVPAIVFVLIYYTIVALNKRSESSPMLILMLVSTIVGFIVMLTAPGNFVRINSFKEPKGFAKYLYRFNNMNTEYLKYMLILTIIVVAILIIARIINFKKSYESEIYAIAGILAYYAMLLSPSFPKRSMVFTVWLFIISIVLSISSIYIKRKKLALLILSVGVVFFGGKFVSTYPHALSLNQSYMNEYKLREEEINRQKSAGRTTYVNVNGLIAQNKYMASYELRDAEADVEFWVNQSMARFYGVESIFMMKNLFFK